MLINGSKRILSTKKEIYVHYESLIFVDDMNMMNNNYNDNNDTSFYVLDQVSIYFECCMNVFAKIKCIYIYVPELYICIYSIIPSR